MQKIFRDIFRTIEFTTIYFIGSCFVLFISSRRRRESCISIDFVLKKWINISELSGENVLDSGDQYIQIKISKFQYFVDVTCNVHIVMSFKNLCKLIAPNAELGDDKFGFSRYFKRKYPGINALFDLMQFCWIRWLLLVSLKLTFFHYWRSNIFKRPQSLCI